MLIEVKKDRKDNVYVSIAESAAPRLKPYNLFYAAFSPIVNQDSRVGQDTQHGHHLTRLSFERTAFLTLTEWR